MRHLPLIVPLLILAACGGSSTDEVASSDSDEVAAASAVAGAAAGLVDTGNLPDFVSVYEGATPVLNMMTNEDGKQGGVFTYTVDATVADVVVFHRQGFEAAGMQISTEMNSAGSVAFGGENEDKTRTLFVTITGGEGGEPTSSTSPTPASQVETDAIRPLFPPRPRRVCSRFCHGDAGDRPDGPGL